ncbi:MAG: hypothetical protein WC865_14145 [Bacteroidales bacterium]
MRVNGYDHVPGSVHGCDLAQELVDVYAEKTGHEVSFEINEQRVGCDLAEVEVLIRIDVR